MSHGAAACASRLTHIGKPLPAVPTDSATARQTARRGVDARDTGITVFGKANRRDGARALPYLAGSAHNVRAMASTAFTPSFFAKLNGQWHKRALQAFIVIV